MLSSTRKQRLNLAVPVSFTDRPVPIAAELRPSWRLAIIVLLLDECSSGAASSLRRLEYLEEALGNKQLLEAILSKNIAQIPRVGVDPTTTRTIKLALAYGLVEPTTKPRFRLTDRGREFARLLKSLSDFAGEERARMARLGKTFTENLVETIDRRQVL